MRDDLDIPMPMGSPSYRVARRSSAIDPNTRRLALIAVGIGGVLLLLIGGYALTGHRGRDGVPLVSAAAGPLRIKPDKPGGMDVIGSDEQDLGGKSATEAMAAPAESADPKALQAQEQTAPAMPQPAQQAALTATDSMPTATAPIAVPTSPEMRPPAAHPAPPTRPIASPAQSTPGGVMQVQLAALTSEEAAMAEWSRLSRKMPDLFAAKHPAVTRTERDGKTWFRLRLGGFSDTAQAAIFCQHVREKGGGCSIATF